MQCSPVGLAGYRKLFGRASRISRGRGFRCWPRKTAERRTRPFVGPRIHVLAGGGVPRDCLSLFLEVLEAVQPPAGDGRIGKDEVRILSRANFERRIEELKQDSERVRNK